MLRIEILASGVKTSKPEGVHFLFMSPIPF